MPTDETTGCSRHGAARAWLPALLLLALASGLSACDTGPDEDEGQFAADVRFSTGGGMQLDGRAFFSANSSDSLFAIEMIPRAEGGFPFREGLVLARADTALPEEGQSYPLAPPDPNGRPGERFAGALLLSFGGSDPALYYAIEGTLQITTVTHDRMVGNFSFQAGLERGDAPLTAEVAGSFSAERGRTDAFPR